MPRVMFSISMPLKAARLEDEPVQRAQDGPRRGRGFGASRNSVWSWLRMRQVSPERRSRTLAVRKPMLAQSRGSEPHGCGSKTSSLELGEGVGRARRGRGSVGGSSSMLASQRVSDSEFLLLRRPPSPARRLSAVRSRRVVSSSRSHVAAEPEEILRRPARHLRGAGSWRAARGGLAARSGSVGAVGRNAPRCPCCRRRSGRRRSAIPATPKRASARRASPRKPSGVAQMKQRRMSGRGSEAVADSRRARWKARRAPGRRRRGGLARMRAASSSSAVWLELAAEIRASPWPPTKARLMTSECRCASA